MNIILLSGGSGKRLWPISNDVRSKQFIKLFKNPSGEYESMLQRVYRQAVTVDPNANITVATGEAQVGAIRNQLGDKVSISIEPCRRDTFPAIALAGAYLHDVKGVGLQEVVTVCPVDFFVDESYYELIGQMQLQVEKNNANLTVIGIEPKYPSEKYGYIIPKSIGFDSDVLEFKEKPTLQVATEYVEKGALWNAGVFSFKLGYILKKAHELIDYTDYSDLYNRYSEVTKISMDYAVVEQERNIRVLRYKGEWDDVGTWNTLTEAMPDETIGNVILDEKCENTKVLNELDIPIVCMACKDLVITASVDGILVAEKEESVNIKPYVEGLDDAVRFAEKAWGTYTILDSKTDSMIIKLEAQKGARFAYRSQGLKQETLNITHGKGKFSIDGKEEAINAGDVIRITNGCEYIISAETEMEIIELRIGDNISKDNNCVYDL